MADETEPREDRHPATTGILRWFEFQQRILALLIAHSEVSAVQVPGLTATLADAAVTLRPLLHPTARLDDSDASRSWGDGGGDLRDGDPTFAPANYRWDAEG